MAGKYKKIPQTPKTKRKISKVMREYKSGTLKSSSGERVTDYKQALAIALSEARRLAKGGKKD